MHADAQGPAEPDTARARSRRRPSAAVSRAGSAAALHPPPPPPPPPPRPSAPRPLLRPSPAPVLHVDAVRRAVVVVWVGLTAAESRIAAGRAERLWEEG